MKYLKKKNILLRLSCDKFEKRRKVSKIVLLYLLFLKKKKSISLLRKTNLFHIHSSNKSKTRLTNMCIITGRSRGVFKSFSASRFVLRTMMGFGILPGYKKAVW